MTLSKAALSAILVVGAGAVAQAQVIYNTFGAGNSFQTGSGYTISGAGSAVAQNNDQGDGFLSAATGVGQTLEIAMGHVTGSTSVTMRLYDADGSGQIGSQNGSDLVLTTTAGSFGSAASYMSVSLAGAGWNFVSGNKYWLIADAADDSWHAWNLNDQGITGDHWWNGGGYSTGATQGAFRLTAVPEPGTMLALGAGLAALAARRRRK